MRLATIDEGLAESFLKATEFSQAQGLFEDVFWASLKKINPEVLSLLGDDDLKMMLLNKKLSGHFEFKNISEGLDEKYFDAEDKGNLELSQNYFSLARLISALEIASRAASRLDFSEAAYEAKMAVM